MSARVTGFLNEGTYIERIGFLHEAQVRFIIEGVSSTDARIAQAQALQAAGLPAAGEPYPAALPPPPGNAAVPFTCRSLRVNSIDGDNWFADARYAQGGGADAERTPDEALAQTVIEVSADVIEVETNIDRAGNLLAVSYTNAQGVTVEQPGLVRVQRPVVRYRFRRTELRSPDEKSHAYIGTVNEDTVGRFARGTLLCQNLSGTSDDSGLSYQVEYVFSYRPEKHTIQAVYRDLRTGQPPADVKPGNGITTFDNMLPEQPFRDLGLPWPR